MRKWYYGVLLLLGAALLAACGGKQEAQIANPWSETATLQEAGELAGFSLSAPDTVIGYPERIIRACTADGSRMIEVIYCNGEDELRIRKGEGNEDISGDYNAYDSQTTQQQEDVEVHLRGSGNMVQVMTWTRDGFSYAVNISNGMPLERALELMEGIE